MNSFLVLIFGMVATVTAQNAGMGGMGTPDMNMNFNLSTPEGIMGFLQMENINRSSLITSNCIGNGNPCTLGGGKSCCLSPVFSCQSGSGGGNTCMVVPGHVNHLTQIRQIVNTVGVTTQNPIL